MSTAIKICGLTDANAVQAVIAAKAEYAGFVYFSASPRHVELSRARELKSLLPASIKLVSVLVDPDDALLEQVQTILQPDYVQLHGKETPARVAAIKKAFPKLKIIKAISVRSSDDVAGAMAFSPYADMLMFDAKPPLLPLPPGEGGVRVSPHTQTSNPLRVPHPSPLPEGEGITYLPGGNGLSFDWALLRNREFPLPWFLSGGLNAENVAEAIRLTGAKMIDVSSGVESAPGVKDPALIEAFVKAARKNY